MNQKPRDKNGFMEDEVRIIEISVKGLSRLLMAEELNIPFETLCSHLTEIYDRARVNTLFQLAKYAVREGYAIW